MIETEAVDGLPALGGKVEATFTIGFGRAEHCNAILGTVCYRHVWDWSARRIKDNAFDSLSNLRLFDNYKFSNSPCGCDEGRAYKPDGYRPKHTSIINSLKVTKQGGDC